eukprot:m.178999 g.178999  ORF g.178999 m.178999 type:complete len:337 (-) comp14663_c0_seq1:343-1353(-)
MNSSDVAARVNGAIPQRILLSNLGGHERSRAVPWCVHPLLRAVQDVHNTAVHIGGVGRDRVLGGVGKDDHFTTRQREGKGFGFTHVWRLIFGEMRPRALTVRQGLKLNPSHIHGEGARGNGGRECSHHLVHVFVVAVLGRVLMPQRRTRSGKVPQGSRECRLAELAFVVVFANLIHVRTVVVRQALKGGEIEEVRHVYATVRNRHGITVGEVVLGEDHWISGNGIVNRSVPNVLDTVGTNVRCLKLCPALLVQFILIILVVFRPLGQIPRRPQETPFQCNALLQLQLAECNVVQFIELLIGPDRAPGDMHHSSMGQRFLNFRQCGRCEPPLVNVLL